jgi:predicted dehydrogenase
MTITVAVVGCGRWGSVHLASLAEMKSSGQVDRVIACDVDEIALNNAIHADATYSSVEEMVGVEQPNLAIIATPNPTHYPLGMALLKNGLNLLIEKPFAPNPDAAATLIQEAINSGCTVSSGHLLRHHPGFQQAKHILLSGEIGETIQAKYIRKTVRSKPSWMGVVEGLASHGIDALDYFFPQQFEFSSPHVIEQGTDHLHLEIRPSLRTTSSLTKGCIEVAWGAEKEERTLQMIGTKGNVEVDFGQHQTISVNEEQRLLNNQNTPLIAQIQTALHRKEMSVELSQSLINTTMNVAMTKTALSLGK